MSLKPSPFTSPQSNGLLSRNKTYYLQTAVFQVEDQLFHLPTQLFINNSDLFATTFSLKPEPGVSVDGLSDEQPFQLAGVTKLDFEIFLKVLYPLRFAPDYSDFTQEDWLKVIKIASMWDFISVRDFAIKQIPLETITTIDKIIFGEQYGVFEWFYRGMMEILWRKTVLELEEAEKIPLSMVLRIQKARERILSGGLGWGRNEEQLFGKIIREHFGAELSLGGIESDLTQS